MDSKNPLTTQGKRPSLSFETDRLSVDHWGEMLRDPARFQQLQGDLGAMLTPDVMRHLPDRVQLADTPSAITDWIKDRDASAAIHVIKDANQLVGLLFLFRPPNAPQNSPLHVGYMFSENSWRRGYASEMVQGLVDHLALGPPLEIQGGVDVNNPASKRVLIKAGFLRAPALCTDEVEVFSRMVGREDAR